MQELLPAEFNSRQQFARWFMNKNIEDNDFPKYVFFTDEATFSRGGVFDTHNLHMWQDETTHVVHQSHHQHRFSVIVQAGIIGNNLVVIKLRDAGNKAAMKL